jgi:hypothetical protein
MAARTSILVRAVGVLVPANIVTFALLLGPNAQGASQPSGLPEQLGSKTNQVTFSVRGELRSFTIAGSTSLSHSEALFTISSTNGGWSLKIDYIKLPGRGPKYREFVWDGVNISQAVAWDAMVLKGASQSDHHGTEFMHIFRGAIPINVDPIDYAAWFAFAGSHYFRSLTNGSMRNIFHELEMTTAKYDISFSAEAPHSIANVCIYRPGVRVPPGQTNLRDRRVIKPVPLVYPPPWDPGFIGAEYTTTSWTNVNGYQFPRDFRLAYRNLHKDSGTGEYSLDATASIIGRVLSITVTSTARRL